MTKQLTISFREGLSRNHGTCREFLQECVIRHDMQQKAIAMEMDYAPSVLSRKLAQSPNDSMRTTLDDLEKYMEVTGDTTPIYYLVDKHLNSNCDEIKRLKEQLAQLEKAGNCE